MEPHLPVRVQAAVTVNCLLNYKQTTDMLRPELPTILSKYIEIMQTLDNEGVVCALEGLVQKFAAEIQPFAVQLVEKCVQAFMGYAKKSQADQQNEDYDGQTEMTAASCLSTIGSILNGELPQSAYLQLVPVLSPLFDFVLSADGCDYVEEGAECLNVVLYRLDAVPATLWFYFPALCYLLTSINSNSL